MSAETNLNLIADQIFQEFPASPPGSLSEGRVSHEYLQSHVFSSLRSGSLDFALSAAARHCDYDVSEYVGGFATAGLGPYERQVLGELLHFPCNLAVITGTAGSGKTSTIRFVLDFYETHSRKASNDPSLQHVYIDANPLQGEARRREDKTAGSALAFLLEKLPNKIPPAILGALKAEAQRQGRKPVALLLDLAARGYRWATAEEEPPQPLSMAQELAELGPIVQTSNPDHDYQCFLRQLRQLKPEQQLEYWFGLLDVVSLSSRSDAVPLLVVVDNVDPFPEYAQGQLKTILFDIAQKSHFKIVLPLRLSTFSAMGFSRQFNWYPHCGPNPIDVIAFRLLSFIRQPERYSAYRAMTSLWRERATIRAFDLLLRITRGKREYQAIGRLISAGSGNSIRRALMAARKLFESRDLSFDYPRPEEALAVIASLGCSLNVVTCLGRLGMALREELVGIAVDSADRIEEEPTQRAGILRLAAVAADLLRHTLLHRQEDSEWDCSNAWKSEELAGVCQQDLVEGRRFALLHFQEAGVAPETAAAFFSKAGRQFAEAATLRLGMDPVPDCLSKFLAAISATLGGEQQPPLQPDAEFSIPWDDRGICSSVVRTNRTHVVSSVVADCGYFVNLFRDPRDGALSPLPLLVLYVLAREPDGKLPMEDFLRHFKTRNTKLEQLLRAVNLLCNAQHRLIWMDKEFAYQTVSDLESQSEIMLSQGGWGYFHSALEEADYTVEMLRERGKQRHKDWLSQRILSALAGLEHLHRQLTTCIPSSCLPQEYQLHLRDAAVALDVAARSTTSVVRAARGHFHAIQSSERLASSHRQLELDDTRRALIRWSAFMGHAEREIQGRATVEVEAARESERRSDVRRISRARAGCWGIDAIQNAATALDELHALLAGDDLWAPHMAGDDFRAVG